jgi:hypothetical protein
LYQWKIISTEDKARSLDITCSREDKGIIPYFLKRRHKDN